MKMINKTHTKNDNLIQIILGNKKKWIGEIVFINSIKKIYFVLPFYNTYIFNLKIVYINFENISTYNENDLLFDQNLESKIKTKLSFINYIKHIKQKNNILSYEYKKLKFLNNLKYFIIVPFSNALFIKNKINFLSNLNNSNLKINSLKKSGFTLVEIKKIFVK